MQSYRKLPLHKLGYLRSGYSMRKKPETINSDDATIPTHWLIPMKAIYGRQKYHIDWEKIEPIELETSNKYAEYIAKEGDLLLYLRGYLKAIAIHQPPKNIFIHNNWAMFTPNENVNPEYIAWWFNHPKTQYHLKILATGSGTSFLTLKDLETIKVPLPSLDIQKKIADLQSLQEREVELMERLQFLRTQMINGLTRQFLEGH
ncbi:MAG: hypothetical protein GW795_00020 [Cyanobacteria bacterium]|nr:hypothetical protein [Cyanobacteria bacterium CG_2015-16_32_12]NCQ03577.1 hypothetical protein [Cyanobacteria bacterium CG_2015-09_32_10]NCQ40304.1 hypothetical protein [Cyanobacteria bacterium CG_2015-04_32_10]NCS84620.1 hypothetical protein [Cyanobacteria bacterium CG_2015-02_32_10]